MEVCYGSLIIVAADCQDSPEEIEKLRAAKKERMRSLGNMQFIGHLFKEEMLTEKIIHQCIVDLLREQVGYVHAGKRQRQSSHSMGG